MFGTLQAVIFIAEDKYRAVGYTNIISWYCINTDRTIIIALQVMHSKVEVTYN